MRSDEIEIKLMTWGSIRFTLDEFFVVLRHRLVVITYFVCWILLFPFRFRPDVAVLDIWREILVFLLSQVVVILTLPLSVALAARMQRNRPNVAVYISPTVFLGTIAGCTVSTLAYWGLTGRLQIDAITILVYALLQVIFAELVGAVVMTFCLKIILTDLRGVSETEIGQDEDEVEAMPVRHGKTGRARNAGEVFIGGKKIPKAEIRIVRAAGNYLDIGLNSEKLFVQATMRSFVLQMDPLDGLLLSRSLWLAAGELEFFQRQGPDILIKTREGETVKTARSRQSEVLAWLKESDIPRQNAPA